MRPAPFLVLASLVLPAACRRASSTSPSSSRPAASAVLSAAPTPAAESPRARDPRWIQARVDDPAEKARLAEAVGATELLAGVDDGGETSATALAALPYADDAEIALGPLADRARVDAARRTAILRAILGVAGRPRRQREPLDPEGARHSGEVLLGLASDTSLPREDRAITVSALRALAEQGYVDGRRIPGDLDPPAR